MARVPPTKSPAPCTPPADASWTTPAHQKHYNVHAHLRALTCIGPLLVDRPAPSIAEKDEEPAIHCMTRNGNQKLGSVPPLERPHMVQQRSIAARSTATGRLLEWLLLHYTPAYILPKREIGCAQGTKPYATSTMQPSNPQPQCFPSLTACHASTGMS